jgi:hypothetical protein
MGYAQTSEALGVFMTTLSILRGGILLSLIAASTACVVAEPRDGYREHEGREAYREGYYDREHHRYYHEHGWRDCGEHDEHCRD